MWDISILKKVDENTFIVLTPNGDTHCIDLITLEIFRKNGRVK